MLGAAWVLCDYEVTNISTKPSGYEHIHVYLGQWMMLLFDKTMLRWVGKNIKSLGGHC